MEGKSKKTWSKKALEGRGNKDGDCDGPEIVQATILDGLGMPYRSGLGPGEGVGGEVNPSPRGFFRIFIFIVCSL